MKNAPIALKTEAILLIRIPVAKVKLVTSSSCVSKYNDGQKAQFIDSFFVAFSFHGFLLYFWKFKLDNILQYHPNDAANARNPVPPVFTKREFILKKNLC